MKMCPYAAREPGSVKLEETRRMSDLMCEPFRPGWQVGISERRKLCRPGGDLTRRECDRWGHGTLEKLASTRGRGTLEKLAATRGYGKLKNSPPRGDTAS